jgi:YfiH family protein
MMEFFEIGGRRYARFERLARQTRLVHAFSTRPHDVAPRSDARQTERAAARRQMATDLGLSPERLCICEQVHDCHVQIVRDSRGGEQLAATGRLAATDAAVTPASGTPLMSFSADCPLILLYDPQRQALGVVHASWRCTVARLAARTVETMTYEFGCDPANLLAGIGPGAGPCCYEVQADVLAAARELPHRERLFERRRGRMYFDLWQANARLLCEAGLRPERIETAGICTMCRVDTFYSFRREGAGCGHFGLMAALANR